MLWEILELAEALHVVYQFDYELKEENFIELTLEQYEALERQGGDMSCKWYRITRGFFEETNNPAKELPIANEKEKALIARANRFIYFMSDRLGDFNESNGFRERQEFLKNHLPRSITTRGEN